MTKSIWICRHGNRIDFMEEGWQEKNGYDPHLSPDGIIQAKKTGNRLVNESISQIYSSPFYRTLETAHHISIAIKAPILIENGFTEWLNTGWFSSEPVLNEPGASKAKFSQVDTTYRSYQNPSYPETNEMCMKRVADTVGFLSKTTNGNILIVSHCPVIPGMSKPLLDYYFEDDFALCSLTKMEFKEGHWTCNLKNDTRHLI
jgi:broad specificity phosphatase PhoE